MGIKWKEGGQKGNNNEGLKSYKRPRHALKTRRRESVVAMEIMLTHSVCVSAPTSPLFLWKKIINELSPLLFLSW
jgi:hypothetical protein